MMNGKQMTTMEKENELTLITKDDQQFLKDDLQKTDASPSLHELAIKLAFKKNAGQLSQEVKQYDPYCRYEIGDLICKSYDEPLMVSSKGTEHFKGTVVLKVIDKIIYDSFNCEMIEVDYTGGGTFRKHIDYMKKTKTQVLLPSSLEGKAAVPTTLNKEEDPRMHELPMTEKDLRTLEKNLGTALSHSDDFFHWNDQWQVSEKQIPIPDKTIEKIKKQLSDLNRSAATTDLVTEFFGVSPDHKTFPLHCLSLNHILEKKHKKVFVFVSPIDWGKWGLKENLQRLLKNIPLSAPTAVIPENVQDLKSKFPIEQKFPIKIYLSWREILSGGIRVPKNLVREMSRIREYLFTDTESGEEYYVFFYPTQGIFLGLSEFYKKHQIAQGASLTLEKTGDAEISFWIKKSKKKLSVPNVLYHSKKDKLTRDGEFQTNSLPNKILYLENETLDRLEEMLEDRKDLDLRELLILVFKQFGIEGEALSLHYQRAYHLADILRQTCLEDIEHTLLLSPEFERSEKKNALFLYHEKVITEEEILPELPDKDESKLRGDSSQPRKGEEDDLPAIGTVGEIETPKVVLEEKIIEPPAPEPLPEEKEPVVEISVPKPKKKPAAPPKIKKKPAAPPEIEKPEKKEKEPKKKKRIKPEVEKGPRRRKGERRIIEERIELEESEHEAFVAVKTDEEIIDEVVVDTPEVETKEFIKQQEAQQPLSGGLFGSMLKDALSQKKSEKTEEPKAKAKKKKK